eukprot:NODE_6713_length_488_cov_251.542725.p3 GENE.NODE_6713_length_488_cov_251.542725~~NODE_6713_length_488_cov_251.542725.p3  ORF type:complete len:83 (-),score=14.82 NODE_6713_length_488_cov_251.542725:144-392(-)
MAARALLIATALLLASTASGFRKMTVQEAHRAVSRGNSPEPCPVKEACTSKVPEEVDSVVDMSANSVELSMLTWAEELAPAS